MFPAPAITSTGCRNKFKIKDMINKVLNLFKDQNKDKGLIHKPLIARTVQPEGSPDFNEVFQTIAKELRR